MRELAAFVVLHTRQDVVRASRVALNIALGLRVDIGLAQVEQRLEVALLHVFAEEPLILLTQGESRLRVDATQLVAGLHKQSFQTGGQLRVLLQRKQDRKQDRQ